MTEGGPGVATGSDVASTTRTRAHWFVFFGIAAAVVVLDQLTKSWLVANVSPGEVEQIVGDWVRLVFSQNSGALFGLFRDNAVVFGIVSLAVIGLIVAYHGRSGRSFYLSIALGLLLGGAVGNLIDRLRLGYVVDFIDIGIGTWRFYTFNLADSAITCSIILLIAAAVFPVLTRLGDRPTDG